MDFLIPSKPWFRKLVTLSVLVIAVNLVLSGCAMSSSKKNLDPFTKNRADGKYSCGEQIPPGQAPRQ